MFPAGSGAFSPLPGAVLSVRSLVCNLYCRCLRRVSFLFRQERYERTDLGEALRGVLPPPHAPSPKAPSRDALTIDSTMFQYCKLPYRNIVRTNDQALREGYIGEDAYDCGSNHLSASPMPHSLGTFLAEQESTAPGREQKAPPPAGTAKSNCHRQEQQKVTATGRNSKK